MASIKTLEKRFKRINGEDRIAAEISQVKQHLNAVYRICVLSNRFPNVHEKPGDEVIHNQAVEIVKAHGAFIAYQRHAFQAATDRQHVEQRADNVTVNAVVDIG